MAGHSQFQMDDDAGIPAPPAGAPPEQAVVDEGAEAPGAPPWAIVPEDPTVGHVATVNELMDVHKDLTGIMEAQAGGDYSTPDYPFVMTYVDEGNEELVVVMHVMAALAGIEYEEREIQVALDTEVDIEIRYGVFELDATPVQVESWKQYYRANCLPSYRPGYQTACLLYEGYLRENGVDPSSLGTPNAPSPTLSTADPCAQSRSSLACYYYTQYKNRCLPTTTTSRCATYATQITTAGYALPTSPAPAPAPAPNPGPAPAPINPAPVPVSGAAVFSDDFESGLTAKWVETGEFDWRADRPDEGTNPPSHASSNKVAEADDCDIGCVLTMRSFLNLSGHASATLEFWRYIDASIDAGEYLRVQVHSNGRWTTVYSWGGGIGDDDRWHKESYSLASHLTNDFKVRFVAKMSSSGEEVAIDDVAVRGTLRVSSDTVPPVVTVPDDMTRTAVSTAGVAVTYTATARDAVDGALTPTCTPASGSTFRVGATTVRCTATDAARNTGSASFRVTVSTADTAAPALSLPRDMTVAATSAAGANVSYTATARDAVDGAVTPSCWPRSGDRFFVGETSVTCRARDSSSNQARGSFTVTVTPFAPAPAPGVVVLSEDFEGGLSRWVESGEPDWRTGTHEWYYNPDGTSTSGTSNDVAKADDCDMGCTLTLARPVNLSGYTGATLTLSRFVDRSLDADEYLRVQAHRGGSWTTLWSWTQGSGDDGAWHHESRSLSSHLVSDFKVRLVARMSSSGEDVGVDNVEIRATGGTRPADTAAPVVTVPADISRTSASGVAIAYTATARDAVDGAIAPTCTPASGSTFAVGSTAVRCSATDSAGNTGRASFTITVRAPDTTMPVITVPAGMSVPASSASGATVTYGATATDNVDGALTPTCAPASGSTFAAGTTTTVTCTARDSSGNLGSASFTVTVGAHATVATLFSDGFESGLSKWQEVSGLDGDDGSVLSYGDNNWRHGSPDDGNPPSHPAANKVAMADACPNGCILDLKDAVDLSSQARATLEFWRYMDSALEPSDNFSVHLHKNGGWHPIYRWTVESEGIGGWRKMSYDLADYRVSDFKIRFDAGADGADEDMAIDDVVVRGSTALAAADTAKPVITSPSSLTVITESSTASAAVVDFEVSAHDAVDGAVPVTCIPAPGASFSLGLTNVVCTATDTAGNRAERTTAVTVTASAPAAPATTKIRGGSPLVVEYASATGLNPEHYGTIAGLVLTHNGAPHMLLSSHVVDKTYTDTNKITRSFNKLYAANPSGNDWLIDNSIASSTNTVENRVVSSDAALVKVRTTNPPPDAGKIQKGATVVTVGGYGGAAALRGDEGKQAEIVGLHTSSSGSVLHTNVTAVVTIEGAPTTYTNHAAASYLSADGDSGSPVIHTGEDGSTMLLGLHAGRMYVYSESPDDRLAHQTTPYTHSDPLTHQFALFSTWENIKRDLSLLWPQ